MRWAADPLALDPLGSIELDPIADVYSAPDPLALEPLSPVDSAGRPIDAHASHSNAEAKGLT